jgi:hypothetical protein
MKKISLKVFTVSFKNASCFTFAMKVTFRDDNIFETEEVEIGKLGKNCRFLVETKASFASQVNSF